MFIDYEIQHPRILSLVWKNLCNEKFYYKIKNNTEKTITLYRVTKSTQINQDYKKLGQILKKSKKEEYILDTTAKFNQTIEKVVLEPNSKIKINIKQQLLPVYWINEETNMLYSITGFRSYDKIVFDEYEEEELGIVEEIKEEKINKEIKEEKLNEESKEIVENIINNIIEDIVKENPKPKTEYQNGMTEINNNLNDINDLIKRLSKE